MYTYTYVFTFLNVFSIKQALFLVHTGMYYLLISDLSERNVIICFVTSNDLYTPFPL